MVTMTEGEATTNGKTSEADETQGIDAKIRRQVEYYFGDYNLPRDKFMQEEIKNDDGWIPLDTMTKFKRLASITTDKAVIAAALKSSKTAFIEVHESSEKIRRAPTHPLPIFNDEVKLETVKRTIYCKGFPKDGSLTLDDLLEYFQQYGPYETVRMRHFFNKGEDRQGFKGSVLVVFPTVEKANEFKDKTEVKYKGTYLIRKWYEDYLEEKKKEIDERRARKEARKNKEEQGEDKPAESDPPTLRKKPHPLGESSGQRESSTLVGSACATTNESRRLSLAGSFAKGAWLLSRSWRNRLQQDVPDVTLPRGTFLHFSGLNDKSEVTREEVKEALGEFAEQCAWVGFSRGMTEGYLRFKEEYSNQEIMEKMNGKLKVKDMEATFRLVEGEEEDEQLKLIKEARSKLRLNSGKKRKSGHQGRGGGPPNKRRK